jgi:methylglutaconyl-CoA hydratase
VLNLRIEPPLACVVLDRPEVRNAFNAALIAKLRDAFEAIGADDRVRAVVLSGTGEAFCGGADVAWMRGSLELSREENVEDARGLSRMLRAIDRLPKVVIGRIQGAALGGGAGLAAVCDIAIAADATLFGFSETRLGIVPAVISPFVLAKIGRSQARALALTGERFDARRALQIGLVHEVVPADALDGAVAAAIARVLEAGPHAVAATKALLHGVPQIAYDETLELTAQAIAAQRVSAEGQEGLRAFLEKRPAAWQKHGAP